MNYPTAAEEALAGALHIYDENGDEEALLANFEVYECARKP